MAIKIGFTGTRNGTTHEQRMKVLEILRANQVLETHHGDCIGADSDFHILCQMLKIPIIIHPCNLDKQRAFCVGATKTLDIKPPLNRNKDIVDTCDVLIACPKDDQEELRSGTWATIRYARRIGRKAIVISPDGTTNLRTSTYFGGE